MCESMVKFNKSQRFFLHCIFLMKAEVYRAVTLWNTLYFVRISRQNQFQMDHGRGVATEWMTDEILAVGSLWSGSTPSWLKSTY